MAKSTSEALRSIAIVSGKGGSGKTLIATAFAMGLASDSDVLLVDADFGTGGLTYYLGFSAFDRARDGLAEYVTGKSFGPPPIAGPRSDALQDDFALLNVRLIPVGEHRLVQRELQAISSDRMRDLLQDTKGLFEFVIVDCRGGIDRDSLAVCEAVDEIVMVVETDAASIQALANVLYESGLGRKLAGFILNKVMDDPSQLAQAGRSFFRCEYLGAVPLDVETTRRFIKGKTPQRNSLFVRHVFRTVAALVPSARSLRDAQILTPEEFGTLSLKNPDAQYGALILAALGAFAAGGYLYARAERSDEITAELIFPLIGFGSLFLAALSDLLKQSLGRAFKVYYEAMN